MESKVILNAAATVQQGPKREITILEPDRLPNR